MPCECLNSLNMTLKNIILVFTLIISLLVSPTKVIAEPIEIVNPTELTIEGQIDYYSELYSVDKSIITKVIQCESRFNPLAHNPNGEDSWGLVQINLDSHPEITKEQAINTNFSINYLAENISNGKGKMWSSFRAIMNDGNYTFYSSRLHKHITVNCK